MTSTVLSALNILIHLILTKTLRFVLFMQISDFQSEVHLEQSAAYRKKKIKTSIYVFFPHLFKMSVFFYFYDCFIISILTQC